MTESSCRWCAYGDNHGNETCRECSRHFADMFTPTRKATKLHATMFRSTFSDPTIAINQAGPGYYVGHQDKPNTLEWVCTVQEAGKILVDTIRRQD